MILDPADPTWDVGNGATWAWDLLAREAESCYDRPCFLQAAGGAVQPWEVPVSKGLLGSSGCTPNLWCSVFSEYLLCTGGHGVWNRVERGGRQACETIQSPIFAQLLSAYQAVFAHRQGAFSLCNPFIRALC